MSIYALHLGIDKYPGGNALYKCVADAKLLQKRTKGEVLLDKHCSRKNLLKEVPAFIRSAGPGDQVILSYSGHGSQVRDTSGDEPDKLDETMVTVDLWDIRDDIVYLWLMELNPKARGWLICDSCFSGTIHRAAPLLTRQHLKAIRKENVRYLPPSLVKNSKEKKTNVGPQDPLDRWVISSGCTDFEFSYEGEDNGVLTGAINKFWGNITFAKLHQLVTREVRDWPQSPQLICKKFARRWKLPVV
jgi:hypothetical protein